MYFYYFDFSVILEKLLTQENRVLEYWTSKKKRCGCMPEYANNWWNVIVIRRQWPLKKDHLSYKEKVLLINLSVVGLLGSLVLHTYMDDRSIIMFLAQWKNKPTP